MAVVAIALLLVIVSVSAMVVVRGRPGRLVVGSERRVGATRRTRCRDWGGHPVLFAVRDLVGATARS